MKNQLANVMYVAALAAVTLSSCSKDDNGPEPNPGGDGKRWITLTAAFPDASGTPGNGGTLAYAISHEEAVDPNHTVRIFDTGQGFSLKSQRTARVQGSDDGRFLYNIQYTGADGGVFNKYSVHGGNDFKEEGSELNTAVILGTSPRWTKAAEGIGVGVSFGEAQDPYTGQAPNFIYRNPKGKIRIANIDLNSTAITNTGSVDVNLGEELEAQGYHVWRADVPVLNAAKDKLFIGLGIRRHDVNGTVTYNDDGAISGWQTTNERELGTTTLVVDYPTLRNPKFITSSVAKTDNLSYRTMTQYIGTDGHIYQAATASGSGHQILRIDKATNEYDDSYEFNLNVALGITDAGIRAFRYIEDGIGVVLYTRTGTSGGYVALIDLNTKTATKLATEQEEDEAYSGSQFTFSQYQNIGVSGDFIYLPLTPTGKDGNVYVINWKTKEVIKGAKLVNQSGSHYLGAY